MNQSKGFTLIELMVVIGIIGLLMAISAPGFIAWTKNAQYKEAGQTALSALREAKGQAINLNQRVPVVFTLDSSAENVANSVTIATVPPKKFEFKKGIEVTGGKVDCNVVSAVSLEFNPNGTTTDTAYICIFDGPTKKYEIRIESKNTGRILFDKF